MQNEIKAQLESLKKDPIAKKDYELVKSLFEGLYLNKKASEQIFLVGVYENGSFVASTVKFSELVYHIWYNTKYQPLRKYFVEGYLLNYPINEGKKETLFGIKNKIQREHAYVKFESCEKEMA